MDFGQHNFKKELRRKSFFLNDGLLIFNNNFEMALFASFTF